MELAVHRRLRRRVADQIERARVAHDLPERSLRRVVVQKRLAARVVGQRVQHVRAHADEAARIEGIHGGVVVVRVPDHLVQPRVRLAAERHAFADEEHRLPPFADRAEVDDGGLQRRRRHLRARELDAPGVARIEVRLLDDAARGDVHAAPPAELVDLIRQRRAVARKAQRVDGGQRIHERDEIGRAERVPHEVGERRAPVDRRRQLADVVFVPEDEEDAHVVARDLDGGMLGRPDLERRVVARRDGPGRFDQLERFHVLRDAVLLTRPR